jgi:hypothetical protein
MSLPAGYTTTTSSSGTVYTTTLYYEGSLLATLSCDTYTWETTLHDYGSGHSWTSTSPIGLSPGGTWTLASNATGTASADGSQISGVCGSGNGYFLMGVDPTTNTYYSEHYHPAFFTSPYRIDTTIQYGGGSKTGEAAVARVFAKTPGSTQLAHTTGRRRYHSLVSRQSSEQDLGQ